MNRSELPFSTGNAILAFCLYVAGQPFPRDKVKLPDGTETEQPFVLSNIYDEPTLFRLGGGIKNDLGEVVQQSSYKGMTLENATEAAMKAGKKGRVEYAFARTNELSPLIAAFDDQQAALEASKDSAATMLGEIVERLAGGQITRSEGLLRIACVILKTRKLWNEDWKNYPALIQIPVAGSVSSEETGRGRVVTRPGFKLISVNAGEDIKKRLKL